MTPRNHIQSLLTCISQGLYEKDNILALALLCAISGESFFLLGPPGTAKSEVSRRLKLVFRDATAFEYLMSRFSTPDEIFGPVSIQKLKSEDTYERKVDGFLPSATVVFLDEIWKAGPAIQNALLTVVNERIYQNGTHTIRVPMKCLIAASNELPAEDEGLEALWDRFLLRVVSNCIADEKTFYKMLRAQTMPTISIPENLLITNELYDSWQQQIQAVDIPDSILFAITGIRKRLVEESKKEGVEPMDYYISDRRWRKNIQILRSSAFLNDRAAVDYTDLLLLIHTLWNKVSCIEPILSIVPAAIFADITREAISIDNACEKEKKRKIGKPIDDDTTPYKKFNYFYLALQNHPKGKCFFFESDYKSLPDKGECTGIMYLDDNMMGYVVRRYTQVTRDFERTGKHNVTTVKLSRYHGSLIIDGTPYPFVREYPLSTPTAGALTLPQVESILTTRARTAIQSLDSRATYISNSQNIFLSQNDLKLIDNQVKELREKLNVILAKSQNI